MTTAARAARKPFARHVIDVLEPRNCVIAVTLLVGWHSGHLAGVSWGLLGALFAVVLPTVSIRHAATREYQLTVMGFTVMSVAAAVSLQTALGAPGPVIALTVTMLAAVAVLKAITAKWKISVRCAVSSGATIVLALTYGPVMLALYALVGVAAWSRAGLKDHTPAQAAAGTILGAALSVAVFLPLR